jgi:hypothetical protein
MPSRPLWATDLMMTVVVPMNGFTFKSWLVTLVSNHDFVHNFGVSGPRAENNRESTLYCVLPPRQTHICVCRNPKFPVPKPRSSQGKCGSE